MKSKASIKGHPLHPMLVALPIGMYVGSFACDIAGAATGKKKLNDTGYHMMLGGLLGGVVAAVPGIVDYLTIVPPGSYAEKVGRKHGITNLVITGLYSANAILRKQGAPLPLSLALSTVAMGLLGYAGWLGGELVYEEQIAVDHLGVEETEHLTLPPCEGLVGEFVPVCRKEDMQVGQMALVTINGERIVVARIEEERFVAFSDHCTHVGGPLSDGTLIGERVMCPWHGSEFNVCTGAVNCGPAKDPIGTFEIRLDGDNVQVKAPPVIRRPITQAGSLG